LLKEKSFGKEISNGPIVLIITVKNITLLVVARAACPSISIDSKVCVESNSRHIEINLPSC